MHASNSSEQQQADAFILKSLENKLNLNFKHEKTLPIVSVVQLDAIDLINKTIVEVYAHIGKLKGAQHDKIMGDILKLIYIEKELKGKWRKIICFADDAAAQYLRGTSWVAKAARTFDVEVRVVDLPEEQLNKVKSAQERQRMVNPKFADQQA